MAEVHDRIAGVRGAFEQTVAGIRNLRAAGVEKVMVKVVVTRHNAALLEAMVVTLLSLTVRDVNFAYVHGCGCTPAEYDALAPRFTELWPQVQRAQASADRVGVDTRFEAFPLCRLPAPWRATEIPHLEGMDSVFTMVGEDTRKWNETRRAMKRKGRRCPTCGLDELCEGVWQEYFERFGDGDLVPQPPQARAEMLFAILCARKERPLC
jgi:hypothetical protein